LKNGKHDEFHDLIKQNPTHDLNEPIDRTNNRMLIYAVSNAKLNFVQTLIQHGADIHLNQNGCEPLYWAVHECATYHAFHRDKQHEHEQLLEKLGKYHDIIKYLLDCGANCDSKGPNGNTALMAFCEWHHRKSVRHIMKDIVILLLDHDSDRTTTRSSDGFTLDQVARANRNDEIADCILNHQQLPDTKGAQMEDM